MKKQYEGQRPSIPADIRRQIEVEAGHQCTVKNCNEHTYLEIHHINQNREDNSIDNLILLCDKHHKMAHKNIIDRKALREYKKLLNTQNQYIKPTVHNDFYDNLSQEFEKRILVIGFNWLETLPNVDWSLKVKTYNQLYSLTEWIDSRDWVENNDIQNSFKTLSYSIKNTLKKFEQHMKLMKYPEDEYYFVDKFYKQVEHYNNPVLREKLEKDFDNHIDSLINLTIKVADNFNTIFRLIRLNINSTFLSNTIIPNLHGKRLV